MKIRCCYLTTRALVLVKGKSRGGNFQSPLLVLVLRKKLFLDRISCFHSHFSAVRADSRGKLLWWKFSLFFPKLPVWVSPVEIINCKRRPETVWNFFIDKSVLETLKSEKHFPQTLFCISHTFKIVLVSVRDLNLSRFMREKRKSLDSLTIFKRLCPYQLFVIFLCALHFCGTLLINARFRDQSGLHEENYYSDFGLVECRRIKAENLRLTLV